MGQDLVESPGDDPEFTSYGRNHYRCFSTSN